MESGDYPTGEVPGTEVTGGETAIDLVQSSDPGKQRAAIGLIENSGLANRSWFLNLLLVGLLVSGGALFLVLLLEYWIIDMDLLGDPSPVWAQTLWFLPQLLVVFLSLQTLVMGVKTGLLQAPSVWMVISGFVAFVFDVVALIFYQRLFWQCVTDTGNFKALEDQICEHSLAELSTIAWFNVIFVVHSLVAIVTGVLVFSADGERFEELRSGIMSGVGRVASRFRSSQAKLVGSKYPGYISRASNKLNRRKAGDAKGW